MGQEAPKPHVKREFRYPTSIPVTVIANRIEHAAEIKDISRLGCCVAGAFQFAKGDEIVVVMQGMSIVATVAWGKANLAGAHFHREVNPLDVVQVNISHPNFARRRLANSMLLTQQA